jgi:hypothetical protein
MAYIGVSPSNGVRTVFDYTATAGQTSFSGSDNNSQTLSYTDSAYIDVYQNGVLLIPSDYTATTGTSVVLDTGATVSDSVQIVVYDVFSVADTVSKANGGTFESNISIGGTLGVTGNVISPVTIGGTTPTLTIGDAGAEDTKIVFDGNAQDFHIGLDDSADSLTIGLGSTLGTTSHMVFDANGHITKPLQSAFLINLANNTLNVTGNATAYGFSSLSATEVFDRNGDVSNFNFTAPVTGAYLLSATIKYEGINSSTNSGYAKITTSNRDYEFALFHPYNSANANTNHTVAGSILADMDANDTASLQLYINGAGSDTVDLQAAHTRMSGFLMG